MFETNSEPFLKCCKKLSEQLLSYLTRQLSLVRFPNETSRIKLTEEIAKVCIFLN